MISPGSAPTFIVDNSAWARLSISVSIKNALRKLIETYGPDAITVCPPAVLEVGFSARNGADHTRVSAELAAFADCERVPSSQDALMVQNALWNRSLVRGAGSIDTLIAAYALANDSTVLHFDSDYEHIARAIPAFRQQWIVPRGSI